MKFTRRLLVVLVIVSAILGIGVLWRASPMASLVSNDHRRDFNGAPAASGQSDGNGVRRTGGGDPTDLVQTLVIMGLIAGTVVVIDKRRRVRNPRLPVAPRA